MGISRPNQDVNIDKVKGDGTSKPFAHTHNTTHIKTDESTWSRNHVTRPREVQRGAEQRTDPNIYYKNYITTAAENLNVQMFSCYVATLCFYGGKKINDSLP